MADVEDADRATWLAERRTGVGASDVAAIMGESLWDSPWTVWADKVGLSPLEKPATIAMRLGLALEDFVAELFTEATGLAVVDRQRVVRRGEFARATLDGYVLSPQHETIVGVFEAKTTRERLTDEMPTHWLYQVQWQLYVTGLDSAWVAALDLRTTDFRVYSAHRDDDLIARLVSECETFWSYVRSETMPPTDSTQATANVLDTVFPVDKTDASAVDLLGYEHVIDAWRDYQSQSRALSEAIEGCRNEIRLALGEHEYGTLDGETVVSWKPTTRMMVDVNKLRAEHGDRYDKPLTFRTLRLHRKGTTDDDGE